MSVTARRELPPEVRAVIAGGALSSIEHALGYAVEVALNLYQAATLEPIDHKSNGAFSLLWSWLHIRPTSEEAQNEDLLTTVQKIVREVPHLAEWAQAIMPHVRSLGIGFYQEERYREAGRLALEPYRATVEGWGPYLYLL